MHENSDFEQGPQKSSARIKVLGTGSKVNPNLPATSTVLSRRKSLYGRDLTAGQRRGLSLPFAPD